MPESIFIHVGQCGNQVGHRFWDLALKEYEFHKTRVSDMTSFFKMVESNKQSKSTQDLKARAVLVDMEEGVISEVLRGPLKSIFSRKQLITDVSGSGNNWAVGNKMYGLKYKTQLIDLFRKEAEDCDNLQSFFLLHSMGGGTGSGLGTAVIEYLYDNFPKIPKFAFSSYPSEQDDVITSPYNTLLANNQLIDFADCVIPFHNTALIDVCTKAEKVNRCPSANTKLNTARQQKSKSSYKMRAFEEMNNVIANTILNMTCSSRFPGMLNVDINDIVLNMTPFPRLHYLVPSVSPNSVNCNIDEMFSEAFSPQNQLFQCSSRGVLLASALLSRGAVSMSDVQFNLERLKDSIPFVPWNSDGWKIGLCSVPHLSYPHSLLMLSNTSAVSKPMLRIKNNFLRMYRKKAHLHHFLSVEGMEEGIFQEALHNQEVLIEEYTHCETFDDFVEKPRLKILL